MYEDEYAIHQEYHCQFADSNHFMHSIKSNDRIFFREMMNKYFMEENIVNFLTGRDYHGTLQEFKSGLACYLVKEYLFLMLGYHREDILKIFIIEYGFKPDDYILNSSVYSDNFIYLMNILQKYMDIRQYVKPISRNFNYICGRGSLDDIKKYTELGFSINELVLYDTENHCACLMSTIINTNSAILKYLLENGIDFRAYEKKLLNYCILNKALAHLKILIEYGADLKIFLNDHSDVITDREKGTLNLLMEYGIDTMLIYQLMTRAIY